MTEADKKIKDALTVLLREACRLNYSRAFTFRQSISIRDLKKVLEAIDSEYNKYIGSMEDATRDDLMGVVDNLEGDIKELSGILNVLRQFIDEDTSKIFDENAKVLYKASGLNLDNQ